MSATLEDLRLSQGDGSLLRSFVGTSLRQVGGWVPAQALTELFGELGVSPASLRTNVSRLRSKGLLLAESRAAVPGWALADDAHPMLARGDRRIFGHRRMSTEDPWMLVTFTVPESDRHLRHQLRSRLTWLGCGSVGPGLWIGPGHLVEETREVLGELDLLRFVTIFRTATPVVEGDLGAALARWWDLPALNVRYAGFAAAHGPVAARWRTTGGSGQQAFVDYLRAVDDWRSIPYLDPSLPAEHLPDYWLGERGVELFAELHERLSDASLAHVREVVGELPRA